jgi:hypothetical protein
MRYGLGVGGARYMCGPFIQVQRGGERHPRWTAWSDGTFRTESIMFEVAATTHAGVIFDPPVP